MKILLRIEHSGTPFHGWQEQRGLLTVQGELQRALSIFINSEAKKLGLDSLPTILITGSGRTDAGVRAADQAASFLWPEELDFDPLRLVHALNGISIEQLHVLSAQTVADDFDARINPHVKTYTYSFLLEHARSGLYGSNAWCIYDKLDIPAMITAAKLLQGQHDFSSFRAQDCTAKTTVRTVVSCELTRIDRFHLALCIQGKGFLKQMVRIIAGTLLEVGRGRMNPEDILALLSEKNRAAAGQTAPAHGLILEKVIYIDQSNLERRPHA